MPDEDDIKRMVAEHEERFGRMDVLMNNAGVGIGGAIEDAETKKLDMQLDVNLRAVYLTTRESIPMLKEAGARRRRADREHGLDRGQAPAGLARRLLGDEGGRDRAHRGDRQGARGRRRALHRDLPRLRRHADDGVDPGTRSPPRR